MENFKFRYENILSSIEKKEGAVKNKLSSAYNALKEEEAKLNMLLRKEMNYFEMINNNLETGCKLGFLRSIDIYKNDLKIKITGLKNKISNLEKNIYIIKQELINISKEKKMMEKLKDKKYEEFKLDLKIQEKKAIDQIVTYSNSLRG